MMYDFFSQLDLFRTHMHTYARTHTCAPTIRLLTQKNGLLTTRNTKEREREKSGCVSMFFKLIKKY